MPPEPKSKAPVPQDRRVARRPHEQAKPATPSLSLLPVEEQLRKQEQLQESVLLQKPKKAGSNSEPQRKDDLAADDHWVLEDLVEDEDWFFFEVPLMEEEDWDIITPGSFGDGEGKSA